MGTLEAPTATPQTESPTLRQCWRILRVQLRCLRSTPVHAPAPGAKHNREVSIILRAIYFSANALHARHAIVGSEVWDLGLDKAQESLLIKVILKQRLYLPRSPAAPMEEINPASEQFGLLAGTPAARCDHRHCDPHGESRPSKSWKPTPLWSQCRPCLYPNARTGA